MAKDGVRLKLLIDTKSQRVLYGEADKNLIDFLFNLLSLPLGTVVRLLNKDCMVGCLGSLYNSVETLNEAYLQTNQNKDTILKPEVSFCGSSAMLLLPNIDSPAAAKFYICPYNCGCNIANDPKASCPRCKYPMNQECTVVQPPSGSKQQVTTTSGEEGGYVKGVVTYMVMDDLTVKPMSTISSIALLSKFNVKEVASLEEKVVTVDANQGVRLLKASLVSKTALTDVFLGKK